jgi:hypothetical protein
MLTIESIEAKVVVVVKVNQGIIRNTLQTALKNRIDIVEAEAEIEAGIDTNKIEAEVALFREKVEALVSIDAQKKNQNRDLDRQSKQLTFLLQVNHQSQVLSLAALVDHQIHLDNRNTRIF